MLSRCVSVPRVGYNAMIVGHPSMPEEGDKESEDDKEEERPAGEDFRRSRVHCLIDSSHPCIKNIRILASNSSIGQCESIDRFISETKDVGFSP